MPPRAVLFDFDGVIADTENVHVAAWQRTLARIGWELADEAAARAAEIDDRFFLQELFGRRKIEGADLDGWIRRAEVSGIKVLQQMAKALAAHRSGLLAYYDVMISSGPMEGTNHKIKTMKRQAYGFRDLEFFKLKILAIHEKKYALVG